jgi:hypothetical protein
MTIDFHTLHAELAGRRLPGGSITIARHEAAICDLALRTDVDHETAHPMWFVIASLRTMGITVDELCDLAHRAEGDTLLFGECRVDQRRPLGVGEICSATAGVTDVSTRSLRDGTRMDSVTVVVELGVVSPGDSGTVTSTYLFRRAAA